MKPTTAATYERARRLAILSILAVNLQSRRSNTSEPEDTVSVFRRWSDFDFLIIALTRSRRAVKLAATIPEIQPVLESALDEFDFSLAELKKLRDVAEQINDYALG
ncbi:hypothetical protein DCC62_10905 [candidate division KSB1 bacterium]|nr:MAG: hypothetical protein DCC62_10905 [candidate division KSB1 bacterium]